MISTREEVSWHAENCSYRRLIEGNNELNLNADIEIRKNLEDKFINEVKASRPGGKKQKKKSKSRSSSSRVLMETGPPLTLKEEIYVKEKVDQVMKNPGGVIRWYLDGQRRFFRRYKESFRRNCRCEKMITDEVEEPPMPKLRMATVKEEQVTQDAAGGGDEEEEGIYF